jgi:hypothetical protein
VGQREGVGEAVSAGVYATHSVSDQTRHRPEAVAKIERPIGTKPTFPVVGSDVADVKAIKGTGIATN